MCLGEDKITVIKKDIPPTIKLHISSVYLFLLMGENAPKQPIDTHRPLKYLRYVFQ